MSRRKIKIKIGTSPDSKKKVKGIPGAGSHAQKRRRKLNALRMMREHAQMMRELNEAKEKEAKDEAARVSNADGDEEQVCNVCQRTAECSICVSCGLPACYDCCVAFTVHNQLKQPLCELCGDAHDE